jgi:hypothetical protein
MLFLTQLAKRVGETAIGRTDIPLYNTLSLCLPTCVLIAQPLFLDRGRVLQTGENRGNKTIHIIGCQLRQ